MSKLFKSKSFRTKRENVDIRKNLNRSRLDRNTVRCDIDINPDDIPRRDLHSKIRKDYNRRSRSVSPVMKELSDKLQKRFLALSYNNVNDACGGTISSVSSSITSSTPSNRMMARSGSVRRWLEDLRYETESYDPQQLQQQQEGSVSWRYARVTWSPETAALATQNLQNQSAQSVKNSDKSAKEMKETIPSIKVETIGSKVRESIARKEDEINSDEQEAVRSRLQTVSITPGTVTNRRLNFSATLLAPPQSPDLILRRKANLPGIPIIARPLSHQTPKQASYLHREQAKEPLPSIIKEGPISKVKLMTGGVKSPKHWKTGMFAVLTDRVIYFSEDADSLLLMKSGAISNSSRERIIDLRDGTRITQDTDRSHSSKRNVLAISNKDGSVSVLMQNDDQLQSDSWFRDVSNVIAKHNDNLKYSGSSSGSTRSKLNWFFKKRPNKDTLVNQGIYKNEPIFGNTLERLYDASEKKILVPAFVRRCTEILENPPHVFSIGLYRTSGNLSHIQKLRLRVDQDDAEALDDVSIASDSDVLAGALKLFFRELQTPLVPYSIYLRLSDACTNSDLEKRFSKSREALKDLPKPHLHTLAVLCQHLLRITVHESQNQMSAANLGIVWGPSFTWPDEGTGTRALHLCTDVNRVVQYLIEESGKLFM